MAMVLGFDSSILSPFARARRLDVLERITSGHRCVVTRAVLDEVDRGCAVYPELSDVKELSWIQTVSVDSLNELVAFNHYVRVLGSGDRNIGEASILAWAEINSSVAVVDDNAAVNAAKARKVAVRRSLGLLCNALHRSVLTIDEVRFADRRPDNHRRGAASVRWGALRALGRGQWLARGTVSGGPGSARRLAR